MSKSKLTFLLLSSIVFFTVSSSAAFAQIGNGQPAPALPIEGNDCEGTTFGCFEVGLPGISVGESIDDFAKGPTPLLSFINFAVKAVIAILVIIGLLSIVIGGYIYMTAAGNGSQVKLAKEIIIAALAGIFLSLVSVIILTTVNKYLGSGAIEPKLNQPPGDTSSAGGGSGAGSGNSSGNSQGGTSGGETNNLPSSQGSTTNNTNGTSNVGGNTIPATNQVIFNNIPERSTPQTASIIMDGTNYYIRDSNGFDRLTDLDGAINAAQLTQGAGTDSLRVRVYGMRSATELTQRNLREGLDNVNISGLQVNFIDRPINAVD